MNEINYKLILLYNFLNKNSPESIYHYNEDTYRRSYSQILGWHLQFVFPVFVVLIQGVILIFCSRFTHNFRHCSRNNQLTQVLYRRLQQQIKTRMDKTEKDKTFDFISLKPSDSLTTVWIAYYFNKISDCGLQIK